jgi:hypothetical protein
MMSANVGDEVIFGTYEQDGKSTNGAEPIEWIVLARKDDRILVISKYVLDVQPFNTSREDITWETCSLRTWLNGDFFNTAFSRREQESIMTTNVLADDNPYYGTDDGNDTEDCVFLLSIPEAEEYFSVSVKKSSEFRICKPTAYALTQGVAVNDGGGQADGNAIWLLRTPAKYKYSRACVTVEGYITGAGTSSSGVFVDATSCGIRPAMWISIDG